MEQVADEIKRLQGCINDLIGVLAFPAIWSGHESSYIVSTLLDVLLGMLRLDFAYARLSDSIDGSPIEVVRLARRRRAAAQPQEVGRALNRWLAGNPPTSPFVVPSPIGEGKVWIAPLRLGLQDEVGVFVAGSQRPDFPTNIEMLLLQLAANQAAIGLQEARLLSEQKRAAEEIRFQAGLLDAVDQAVVAIDINGVITYWNRFAERLYGWSAPEVIGRNILDIIPAQRSQRAAAKILSRLQRGERWAGEFLVQHRDGTNFPVLVTDSPIYDSQGVLIGIVGVFIDITERKRAEEELERRVAERTAQLTAANEELVKKITERQRSEQRLATQYAVTRVLAESDTLADATPHLLRAIGESMAWEWGALWNIDRDAGVLRCQSIWHAPNLEAAEFDAISRQTAGMPGPGLKGRVWQSAEPTWIAEATNDPNYMRAPIAAKVGLHGAVAFPILLRGETVGIIEFFSRTVRQPDQEQLAMLSAIGSQIGQFVERKRVEEEQRKLAALVEHSTDFIGIASPEGQVLFVNPAGQKMVGLDGYEQVRTTSLVDYVAEEERERFQEQVLPAVLRDRRWEGETHFRHFQTGAAIQMLHHLFCIKEQGSDRRLALATISRDITERKQAEEALRAANERVAMILDSITDNFFAIDKDWRYTYLNTHAAEQMKVLGKDPARLIGKVLWEEFPNPTSGEHLRRAMSERAVVTDEQYYPPLGEWYENRIYPSPDGGIAVFQRYVTERKRIEEELRRSEAYLVDAQRLSHTGSWAWKVSTGELFWSQEHFRICGLDPEKVKPSYPMALQWIHPEDRSFVQRAFEKAIRERSDFELDCRIVRPDGIIRYVHSLGHPVFNESGVLTEYVGTIIDTTERKQAEEALLKAQAELVHVTRVLTLGALTASIAHEVNQPLAAIVTNGNACLRWLAHEVPELDEARAAVERIIRDSNRASGVIRRIRALAKNTTPQKAWLDLNDVIHEVIALVQSEVHKHRVSLLMELSATLPLVLGDRIQLQQVLLNLMMNGIEAMHPITDRPRELLIRSQSHEFDTILVAVRDSGIGLDPQSMAQLFDAFFTTKPEGMGLGLSISRTIIEAHSGRLWATPNDDHGVTLLFTLPTGGTSV